jgi:hypothetical protein
VIRPVILLLPVCRYSDCHTGEAAPVDFHTPSLAATQSAMLSWFYALMKLHNSAP